MCRQCLTTDFQVDGLGRTMVVGSPQSLDLLLMDFSYRAVKNIMYQENIQSLDHLRDRVTETIETIPAGIITRV